MCFVERMEYNFDIKQGTLWMQESNCCNMSQCIEMFRKLDPEVKLIITYPGAETGHGVSISPRWLDFSHCEDRSMKEVIQKAINEITALRRKNEILEAKVEVLNIFRDAIRARAPEYGYGACQVDIVFKLENEIKRIDEETKSK